MRRSDLPLKYCQCCGVQLESKTYKPNQFLKLKYCSLRCRDLAARKERPVVYCKGCGKQIDVQGITHWRAVVRKYCRKSCRRRENNVRWGGGRYKLGDGYVMVLTEDGARPEHRVVMEKILGRKLKRSEVVHHMDGDKANNHPNNLRVMTNESHRKWHETMSQLYAWENYGPAAIDPMRMVGGC